MEYGLIGERLTHSYSREVHAMLADYTYELCELKPSELDAFLTKRDFKAINVTIPYKEAVIPYLSYIDPEAEKIGAVNTVINRGGKLYGYNTDIYGMCALIRKTGKSVAGKKVAVLGTGGTSKTAKAALKMLGAGEILLVSRTKSEFTVTYSELEQLHRDVEFIINTTPVGMYPNTEAQPISLLGFEKLLGVVDVIYNPLRTRLVLEAEAMGISAASGLYMLVMQAAWAAGLFLDKEPDISACECAYRQLLIKKENTVLIGMPGAGKTTVAKLLAKRLNKEATDTDDTVRLRAECEISEIFERYGEGEFRKMESLAIRDSVYPGGRIIATGGGAVLNRENVLALKSMGRLYFLDRPLESLATTNDRPLSKTPELLRQRFRERYAIYNEVCDVRINASTTAEDAMNLILSEMEK